MPFARSRLTAVRRATLEQAATCIHSTYAGRQGRQAGKHAARISDNGAGFISQQAGLCIISGG
ncbi:hypothetical protein LZ31DRAFT_557487 [Colletotrichum somersetense]|nr:hypothetical protein LZ31DRAFT_557487 [Colletotrichum somersetense]